MITRDEFSLIYDEVNKAINDVFDYIFENSLDHNYVLFLADGEYKEQYLRSRLNPFVIDSREDKYKDESRLNFFIQFMKTFYSFPTGTTQTDDNEQRLHMELMIYSHTWESKPFLKQLYRLASLVDGNSYLWDVTVPEMSKHSFIRSGIRNTFRNKGLHIAQVITNAFHTSLRNAFAHSEYVFDNTNRQIHLDTYKGETWDLENISYDDWTKRFVYSALISYLLINEKHERRISLITDFGRDTFSILHPVTERKFILRYIYYEPKYDQFSFHPRY